MFTRTMGRRRGESFASARRIAGSFCGGLACFAAAATVGAGFLRDLIASMP